MKTIPLTQGLEAMVDDEDYDKLCWHSWCAHEQRRTHYAVRREKNIEYHQPGKIVKMHQVILGVKEGFEIDHIDRNGLNNQRSNLRYLPHAHNLMNSVKRDGEYSSQYKGVSWCKVREKWAAYIWVNKKRRFLGRFDDELDAAIAYDNAAIEAYGEIARLNIPISEECNNTATTSLVMP